MVKANKHKEAVEEYSTAIICWSVHSRLPGFTRVYNRLLECTIRLLDSKSIQEHTTVLPITINKTLSLAFPLKLLLVRLTYSYAVQSTTEVHYVHMVQDHYLIITTTNH